MSDEIPDPPRDGPRTYRDRYRSMKDPLDGRVGPIFRRHDGDQTSAQLLDAAAGASNKFSKVHPQLVRIKSRELRVIAPHRPTRFLASYVGETTP